MRASNCPISVSYTHLDVYKRQPDENATAMVKLEGYTDGYYQLAIYALVAGVVLIALSPIVRKMMQEVK